MFRSNNNHSLQSEIEQLKATSSRLETLVEELRLEISFYKGEVKRLEWEKDLLNQDMTRMSGMFKNWIDEVRASRATRNIAQETAQFNAMVKYPCKSIADLLQLNSSTLLVTSSQAPHFVEYANKLWCQECGWNSSDILGYTCSFLQGPLTDKKVTEAFMKDLKEVGYSRMHVYNYRKNGEMFEVNITVFPVFDSISSTGPDSEVAVLTHFASVMTDMKPIANGNGGVSLNGERVKNSIHHHHRRTDTSSNDGSEKSLSDSGGSNSNSNSGKSGETTGESDSRESPTSDPNSNHSSTMNTSTNNSNENSNNNSNDNSNNVTTSNSTANLLDGNNDSNNHDNNNDTNNMSDQNGKLRTNSLSNGDMSSDDSGMDTSSNQGSRGSNSGSGSGSTSSENSNYDRRNQSQRFEPKCVISEESFYNFGHTLRLSNLLRLMLSCNNAMILTNKDGRIVHVNTAWCQLTGYSLIDIEGKTCKFLQGPDTDHDLTKKMKDDLMYDRNTAITVYNYKKDGERFLNKIIAVPIHGGYLEPGISHYCALLVPMNEQTSQSSSSLHEDLSPIGMEIIFKYADHISQRPHPNAGPSNSALSTSSTTGSNGSTGTKLTEIKLPTISLLDVAPALINPLSLSRGVISVNMENYINSNGSGDSGSGRGGSSEGNMSESNSEHNGENNDSNEDNDANSSGSSRSHKSQREEDDNNNINPRPSKKLRLN